VVFYVKKSAVRRDGVGLIVGCLEMEGYFNVKTELGSKFLHLTSDVRYDAAFNLALWSVGMIP
jgi:hypothetical protein